MSSALCRGRIVTLTPLPAQLKALPAAEAGAGDGHSPELLPSSEHADHIPPQGLEEKLLCSGSPGCPDLAHTIPTGPEEGLAVLGLVPARSWLPHCGALREGLLLWVTVKKGKSCGPGFLLPSGSTSSPLLSSLSAFPRLSLSSPSLLQS